MPITEKEIKLRASQMPLAFRCPGSIQPDGLRFDHVIEEATLGTAVHAVLAHMVSAGLENLPDLLPFRKKYGLENDDEFQMLCWFGWKAWQELKEYFQFPKIEKHLKYPPLSGHLDVWSDPTISPVLLDWKSGRLDTDAYHQIAAYCYLSMKYDRESSSQKIYTGIAVYLREQYYRKYTFTQAELLDWVERVENEILTWDGVYHIGSHCRFCRHQVDCPARRSMIQSTLLAISDSKYAINTGQSRTELGPPLGELYERVKAVENMVEQFRDWLRSDIAANGPLPVGGGKVLNLLDRNKDSIDPLKAWDILSENFTAQELAPAIKISKTTLLQTVSDRAVRGLKKQAKEALMNQLEKAGAVSQNPYQVLGYQEKEAVSRE